MGEHKHGTKGKETKVTQAKREEEQLPEKKPAEALSRLSVNVAQPKDVLALQRTLGNRVVTNLIQRHPEDTTRINLLRIMTNARIQILSNQISENRSQTNELTGSTTENFTNHQNTLTSHSSKLNENSARISSLESEEKPVIPVPAGGI
jgi:hypothetical protein